MRLKQLVEVMRGTRWILLDQTFTAVVLDKVDAGTSGKIVIWGDGVGGDVMVQQAGDVRILVTQTVVAGDAALPGAAVLGLERQSSGNCRRQGAAHETVQDRGIKSGEARLHAGFERVRGACGDEAERMADGIHRDTAPRAAVLSSCWAD